MIPVMTCVRPHILLADDDPMVRRITGDMLRLLGYDVMGMLSFPLEGDIANAIYQFGNK